jgi:hypothetical protein
MLVSKEVHTRFSTTIVKVALDKNTQQGAFAGVNCTQS